MKRLTKKELQCRSTPRGGPSRRSHRRWTARPATSPIPLSRPARRANTATSIPVPQPRTRMRGCFAACCDLRMLQAAEASIERIDALFHQFAQSNDRRGQHQAQLMALIGKNRAEGIGKLAEARIFSDWLVSHLDTARAPLCDRDCRTAWPDETDPSITMRCRLMKPRLPLLRRIERRTGTTYVTDEKHRPIQTHHRGCLYRADNSSGLSD